MGVKFAADRYGMGDEIDRDPDCKHELLITPEVNRWREGASFVLNY